MKNRLREIREARGMSQSDLGRMLDTTGVSISRYEKEDGRITLTLLEKLASALQCRPEDLIADGEIPSVIPVPVRDHSRSIWFDGREVAAQGMPQTLEVVVQLDDSMEPTIGRGDMAVIDTSVDRIEGEGLYAFAVEGRTIIKRAAFNLGHGTVALMSDNPSYRDLGEAEEGALRVAGKVSMVMKRM